MNTEQWQQAKQTKPRSSRCTRLQYTPTWACFHSIWHTCTGGVPSTAPSSVPTSLIVQQDATSMINITGWLFYWLSFYSVAQETGQLASGQGVTRTHHEMRYRMCTFTQCAWKLPEFAEIMQNNAITPFKVIQGHRFWYQSKAHIRFPISD